MQCTIPFCAIYTYGTEAGFSYKCHQAIHYSLNDRVLYRPIYITVITTIVTPMQYALCTLQKWLNNYKDKIMHYFQKINLKNPIYDTLPSTDDNIKFKIKLSDTTGKIHSIGIGNNKPNAEQNAAYNALKKYNVL